MLEHCRSRKSRNVVDAKGGAELVGCLWVIQSLQLHRAGPTTVISRSMADGSQSRARDRGVRAEVV